MSEVENKVEDKKEVVTPKLSSVFITEDDTFDISVEFYKEKTKIFVKDIDADFDVAKKSEKLDITLKYPSQRDVDMIASMSEKQVNPTNTQEISLPDFLKLEVSRLLILMRKWSAGVALTAENVYQLNPKIVKGIILKVRSEIGMDGII